MVMGFSISFLAAMAAGSYFDSFQAAVIAWLLVGLLWIGLAVNAE